MDQFCCETLSTEENLLIKINLSLLSLSFLHFVQILISLGALQIESFGQMKGIRTRFKKSLLFGFLIHTGCSRIKASKPFCYCFLFCAFEQYFMVDIL